MSQSVKYLHVDSSLREHGPSHNFSIGLSPAIFPIKGVKLMGLQLPISNFNVSSSNNIISVFDGVSTYNATVTPGIYDTISILPAIKSAIEATPYTGTITATYSDITQRLNITGTSNLSLAFSNTTNSMASLLGFLNNDTVFGLSHISTNAINLSIPPCIFIKVNEFPMMCKSTNGVNGTFAIYINVISGEINFLYSNTHYEVEATSTLTNINRLNISLIDPRTNTLFDIQNNDWSMLLEFIY